MSRDRLLPGAFETVNAGGTPTVAHWTSIGVAAGFIVSGTVNTVLALCAFFFVVELHAVVPERVRAPAEGARHAEAVAGARVSVHDRARGAGLGGVPGRIGGERLGQQLEVDAAAGAQLSGVSGRRRQAGSGGRELAVRFTRAIVRPPAATFAAGITSSGLGPPDLALALRAARGLLPDAGAAGALARQARARSRVSRLAPSSRMPPSSPLGARSSPAPAPRAAPARWRRSARRSASGFPIWTRSPPRARWTAATCARRASTSSSASPGAPTPRARPSSRRGSRGAASARA